MAKNKSSKGKATVKASVAMASNVKALKKVPVVKPLQGVGYASLSFGKSTFTKPIPTTAFKAMVKAKANKPNSLFTIGKLEKSFDTGKAYAFDFTTVKLPKAILPVLQSLYTHYGFECEGKYQFAVKAGYGAIQAGYNRAGHSSWKGLFALNDGQLCTWSWPERGLTFAKICKLGNDNGLNRNRQGKNWVTYHYSKDNADACLAYGKAIMNTIKFLLILSGEHLFPLMGEWKN